MRWKVHGHQELYASEWVNLELADVELPDGRRLQHHVVHMPKESAFTAIVNGDQVLMLWRHRFITDRWGWELPGGWVDPGEDPTVAAMREAIEETGWKPGTLELLCSYSADNGISDSRFHLYHAVDATYQGPPTDAAESSRIEWVPLASIRSLIRQGKIDDGATLTALVFLLAFAR